MNFKALGFPLIGLFAALIISTLLLWSLGERPLVLLEAIHATFTTGFGLGYVLFYTTPLIFTGLSVALAFQTGLFNIGAEGQLYLGALGVVMTAQHFSSFPSILAVPLGIMAAMALGGLLGAIAGFLKAHRGSHEVVVTLLLNFIAVAVVEYLILYAYKNPEGQNPESAPVAPAFTLPSLHDLGLEIFRSTPVNVTLGIALLAAMMVHFLLFHTTVGYEMRAVGENLRASRFAGISVKKYLVLSFFLSGALAGLVGVNEIMGHQHRLIQGFSPQYGFTAIAVALVARNRPLGVLLSALLFGSLFNISRELEFLSNHVTKELSLVIQAILIGFVAAEKWLILFRKKAYS